MQGDEEQEGQEEEIPAEEQEAIDSTPSGEEVPASEEPTTGAEGEEASRKAGAHQAGVFFKERKERTLQDTQDEIRSERETLAELKRQTEAARTAAPADATPKLGPMPRLEDEDVNFDQDVLAQRLATWVDKRMEAGFSEFETRRAAKQADDDAKATVDDFDKRAEDYAQENPEYRELFELSKGVIQPSSALSQAIVLSDNGPAVHHALLSDPKEYERINKLPDVQAVIAFGKLEASMSLPEGQKKNPAKRDQTDLPRPLGSAVGGGASTGRDSSTDIYEKNLSPEEYERREQNAWNQDHPA